jgi:ATP-dependent RNA helicase DeaD
LSNFESLGISEQIVKALTENKIITPSEIQKKSIPFLMQKGTDFIGQAQTGTGKTAAFGLPILHQIDPSSDKIQVLILCPTRELCQQIAKQLFTFTKYCDKKIFVEAVFGGAPIGIQIGRLQRPTHIVVATPGRLVDLQEKQAIDLSRVKTVVLDEADEMLTLGFKEDLDKILQSIKNKKATWLFSATMSPGINAIIHNYMAPDAHKIEVNKHEAVNKDILHQYVVCDLEEKPSMLFHFLKSQGENRGVIFCRTKASAQALNELLKGKKYASDTIHGDLKQIERDKVMRAFKNTKVQILIATDIAARGIDVENLSYVVHYELPDQHEYYTHRSGRTARAGNKGLSLSIITPKETQKIRALEKSLGIKMVEAK